MTILEALEELEKTRPADVYAGRRGLVAGVREKPKACYCFRRAGERLQFEVHDLHRMLRQSVVFVPAELCARVQAMLDRREG